MSGCLLKWAREKPNAMRLNSSFPICRHCIMAPVTARRRAGRTQI